VITNNVSAVMELGQPGFHYMMTGGEFQPRSNSLAGRFALDIWAWSMPIKPFSEWMESH